MAKEKTHINLEISKELLAKIKAAADEQEISYSSLIRLAVQEYLKAN